MLKLWGRKNSLNVQKIMWFIGELRLEHCRIDLGGAFGGLDTPEFLALNPHGHIPVLQDNTTTVWESHAILRYLAAQYGTPTFWSETPSTRAQQDMWIDWELATLQPAFMDLFWSFYRTPNSQHNSTQIQRAIKHCAEHYTLLDRVYAPQKTTLTLSDFSIGSTLFRYFNLDINRPSLPNLEAWYRHLTQKPAYQEHVMIDFTELLGRQNF